MSMLLFAAAVVVAAASPPASSCKPAENRQLDFWLGDWHAQWDGGEGTNRIAKSYGGCVIEEHFDGRPGMALMGHSVSVYLAPEKRWRQTRVDNEGGYIDLAGGPMPNGDFVLTTLPRAGSAEASRMIFTDIKRESFTWRWQGTRDGKTWADKWVIRYTRMKA